LTLEQAQRRKHGYIAEQIGIQEGRQEQIYPSLFENIAGVLPAGGRLYLQTMVIGPRALPALDRGRTRRVGAQRNAHVQR
jgi:hypothetical protein